MIALGMAFTAHSEASYNGFIDQASLNSIFSLGDLNQDAVRDYGLFQLNSVTNELTLSRFSGAGDSNRLLDSFAWSNTLSDPQILILPDHNNDGIEDIALFGQKVGGASDGKWQLILHSGADYTSLAQYGWPNNWSQVQPHILEDMDGDGVREIALSGVFKQGSRPQLIVKSGSDPSVKIATYSFPALWNQPQYIQLADQNDDGISEVGLYGVIKRNGKPQMKVVSGKNSKDIFGAYNAPSKWAELSLHKLIDFNGDGAREVGFLGKLKDESDGRWQLLVKKGDTHKGLYRIYSWPSDMSKVRLEIIPDLNFDGIDDIALFGFRASINKYQLLIKSGQNRSENLGRYNWPKNIEPISFQAVPDFSEDGVADFSLLAKRKDNRLELILMSSDIGADNPASILLDENAVDAHILTDIDSNESGQPEVAVISLTAAGESTLSFYSPTTQGTTLVRRHVTNDLDGDHIPNALDSDDDNDGVEDSLDVFPQNDLETLDTDNDGMGDNADSDDDNDGIEDDLDAMPKDATESEDTDGDGVGNNADTDDDNDGVEDTLDQFPKDSSESIDTDGDGIGNNRDDDDDNDGIPDAEDDNPLTKDVIFSPTEIHVNQTLAYSQQQSDVAIDEQGNFVVVWEAQGTSLADERRSNIYARRFSADGTAIGSEFRVNDMPIGEGYNDLVTPSISMNRSGEFAISWIDERDDDTSKPTIGHHIKVFNADGSVKVADFAIQSNSDDWGHYENAVTLFDDGSFVLVHDYGRGFSTGLAYHRFDANGDATAEDEWLVDVGWGSVSHTVVAANANDISIVWEDGNLNEDINRIDLSSDDSMTSVAQVNMTEEGSQTAPDVSLNSQGASIVVWRDAQRDAIYAQRFDSDGSKVGSELLVSFADDIFADTPQVHLFDDDSFVVTWEGYSSDDKYGSDIYFRHFDTNNMLVGETLQVNSQFTRRVKDLAMDVNGQKQVVITWTDTYREERDEGGETHYNDGVYAAVFSMDER